MTILQQREYFKLAASVLCCYLVQNGRIAYGKGYGNLHEYNDDLIMQGEIAYSIEMKMLLEEVKQGVQ